MASLDDDVTTLEPAEFPQSADEFTLDGVACGTTGKIANSWYLPCLLRLRGQLRGESTRQ
jgi:hypothetical protein